MCLISLTIYNFLVYDLREYKKQCTMVNLHRDHQGQMDRTSLFAGFYGQMNPNPP